MNSERASQEPHGLTSYHVGQARSGDAESLAWLIARLSPLLIQDAHYRMGKVIRELYDPEDIVHDVWLATIPRLGDLSARDGRYTPVLLKFLSKTLLYRINNLIAKHVSGKPVRKRFQDTAAADPVDALEARDTTILTRLQRDETWEAVTQAIDDLPVQERTLMLLRGVEQRSYKEISPLLGRDPNSLSATYGRILAKLRRALPGSIFEELAEDFAEP